MMTERQALDFLTGTVEDDTTMSTEHIDGCQGPELMLLIQQLQHNADQGDGLNATVARLARIGLHTILSERLGPTLV